MHPLIGYDDRNMRVSEADRRKIRPRLSEAHRRLEALRASGEQGFFDLPFDRTGIRDIESAATRLRTRFSHLVVVGIGGSDLGARCIWQALGGSKATLTFVSNPDPETVSHAVASTDWSRTAILVVSKSGTTLETMAVFAVLRDALIKRVGAKRHAAHVIAVTDPSPSSVLYSIATDEGYEILPHPSNVGGRFSVLSVVGLFPAAFSGVHVKKMLAGARASELERRDAKADSLPARIAANQYLSLMSGRPMHVLMPYADLLSQFCFWYRQLWAESLGKKREGVSVGPTPIAALGAIDQHSQIQLYNEGPDDKTITFLEVSKFRRTVRVPRAWKNRAELAYIGGLSLERILHAERAGTELALAGAGRPNATLTIPSITPESLGALFMTFEAATAYMGELLEVNAFDQPGVQAGKTAAKRLLVS